MLVLLYEFPAETRLTVYRRLDIVDRWVKLEEYGNRAVNRQPGFRTEDS